MKHLVLAGHISALLTIVVWGVTFVSTKILLASFSPFEILYLRFSLGWCALWIICPARYHWRSWRQECLFALAGLTGISLYFLLENLALVYTQASHVAVLVTSAPFFTAMLAWLAFGARRPGKNFFLGFLLATGGVAMISGAGASLRLNPAGDLLALGAALAWAFYSIFTRRLAGRGYGALMTTRHIFFYGLLFMLPFIACAGLPDNFDQLARARNWLNLLFLGLVASAACFASWTFSLNVLGVVRTSLYIYLVPVVTVIFAALVLDEQPTFLSLTGVALTILGLLLAEARRREGT